MQQKLEFITRREFIKIVGLGAISLMVPSSLSFAADSEKEVTPWIRKSDMPTRRILFGVGVIEGKLYAVGGFGDSGQEELMTHVPVTEVYDPKTNKWERRADMPTARSGLGVGVIEGKLYAVGGFGNKNHLPALEVYDPQLDKWAKLSDMPTARSNLGAGVIDNKLYAVGGVGSWRDLQNRKNYHNDVQETYSALEVYDPQLDKWAKLSDMPTARSNLGVGVINDKLYAIGGERLRHFYFQAGINPYEAIQQDISVLEIYDPKTNSWKKLARLPTARSGLGAGVIDGKIHIVGGYGEDHSRRPIEDVYDPNTDEWTRKWLRKVGGIRTSLTVGVIDDKLYAIGSHDDRFSLSILRAFDPKVIK